MFKLAWPGLFHPTPASSLFLLPSNFTPFRYVPPYLLAFFFALHGPRLYALFPPLSLSLSETSSLLLQPLLIRTPRRYFFSSRFIPFKRAEPSRVESRNRVLLKRSSSQAPDSPTLAITQTRYLLLSILLSAVLSNTSTPANSSGEFICAHGVSHVPGQRIRKRDRDRFSDRFPLSRVFVSLYAAVPTFESFAEITIANHRVTTERNSKAIAVMFNRDQSSFPLRQLRDERRKTQSTTNHKCVITNGY